MDSILQAAIIEASTDYWIDWNFRAKGVEWMDNDTDEDVVYENQYDSRYPIYEDEILGELILV